MIKANIAWSAKQIAKAVTKGSMVFEMLFREETSGMWFSRACSLNR